MNFRNALLFAPLAALLSVPVPAQFGDVIQKAKDKAKAAAKQPAPPQSSAGSTPSSTSVPPASDEAPSGSADARSSGGEGRTPTQSGAGSKDEGGGGKDYEEYKARQGRIQSRGGPKSAANQANNADVSLGRDMESTSSTSGAMSGGGQNRASDPQLKQLASRIHQHEETAHQGALTLLTQAGEPIGDNLPPQRADFFAPDLTGKDFDREYIGRQSDILYVQLNFLKSRKNAAANGRTMPSETAQYVNSTLTALTADREALAKIARASSVTIREMR